LPKAVGIMMQEDFHRTLAVRWKPSDNRTQAWKRQ
jgi:hypothetical protein